MNPSRDPSNHPCPPGMTLVDAASQTYRPDNELGPLFTDAGYLKLLKRSTDATTAEEFADAVHACLRYGYLHDLTPGGLRKVAEHDQCLVSRLLSLCWRWVKYVSGVGADGFRPERAAWAQKRRTRRQSIEFFESCHGQQPATGAGELQFNAPGHHSPHDHIS